ncbi:hypothetical protein ABPG74_000400 [Tetrahymena malaccensis]
MLLISYLMLLNLKLVVSLTCEGNQIYDAISQLCIQCPSSCLSCYNDNQDSCITCNQNFYMSSSSSSTCQQNCQKGEIKNENQQCVKCQVPGCIKCDEYQICLQCDFNLILSQANNQCLLQKNICDSEMPYILEPYNLNQCVMSCPQSYYQNEITQICEKSIQCIQVEDESVSYFDKRVLQIEQINQDQYLVRTTYCTFLLIDTNLNVISVQVLQNMQNYDSYMYQGSEMYQKSFIVGSYGGCLANNTLVVLDFKTLNVVFNQTNLAYDQTVKYVDQTNQIVFMAVNQINNIFWYDALSQTLNQQNTSNSFLGAFFQWQNLAKTNYFIKIDFSDSMMDGGTITNIQLYSEQNIQAQYYLKCDQNLIVVYYPILQILDLGTGQPIAEFLNDNFLGLNNVLQSVPIVDTNGYLVVYYYQPNQFYFFHDNYFLTNDIFEYKQNSTSLYYDLDNNILIGVTGDINQINIINTEGTFKYFTYETSSKFSQGASYYYKNTNSLIVFDNSPIIYLFNYLTKNVATFKTQINNIKGIIMDEFKNVIFVYQDYFISTFQFPNMQFIETISVKDFTTTPIKSLFINSQISILITQTQSSIITFDLTEILYTSETNLLQYQSIQGINIQEKYLIYYSTVNLSLNLFKDSQLVDTLLFDPNPFNIYPYFTSVIQISQNQFVYITYNTLSIIQFDLLIEQLNLIQNITLLNSADHYFFDKQQNQIFLFYERISSLYQIDLNQSILKETYLTNFTINNIIQTLIFSDFILLIQPDNIQVFNFIQNIKFQLSYPNNSSIKFALKLQYKKFQDYQNDFWNTPFEYEEKYNINDPQQNDTKLLCLIVYQENSFKIQIVNLAKQQVDYQIQMEYIKITNAVIDPFRQLIYIVTNIGNTQVFSYTLRLISSFQNACIKQALISYDKDFIYSICPNDVIVYNALSFQPMFPKINLGLSEVNNFIKLNYNNYFIVLQKIIPLSKNKICNVMVQQQNRIQENIYTKVTLNKTFEQMQNSNYIPSVISIQYYNQQYIQDIDLNLLQTLKNNSNYPKNLIIQSDSLQSSIFWDQGYDFKNQIQNLQLKQMNLSIVNQIDLNKDSSMNTFQMFNINLNLNNNITLQNFEKVLIQNITLQNKILSQLQSQITILNCKLVVIENILISNFNISNVFFNISNNSIVIIKQVQITNVLNKNLFSLINNNEIQISDIGISQSKYLILFEIQISNILNATNLYITQVESSIILNISGIFYTKIEQINASKINSVYLTKVQPLLKSNLQNLCNQFDAKSISIQDSVNAQLYLQANTTTISALKVNQFTISQSFMTIYSTQSVLDTIFIANSSADTSQNTPKLIEIVNFQNSVIKNINFIQNKIPILSMSQQTIGGTVLIVSSKFIDVNIQNDIPLINLENIQIVQLNNLIFKNITLQENIQSSILVINSCNQVNISESQFTTNINSKGKGGSIQAIDNQLIEIKNSQFTQNECQSQNGGALFVSNSIFQAQVIIQNSLFSENTAIYSTGGAIHLENSNLKMQNSSIFSNQAAVGGGIYYQQIIPDFVLDYQKGLILDNSVKNNYAKIYGKNFGSTLRTIKVSSEAIKINNQSIALKNTSQLEITEFKSGNQIQLQRIQILDEENNPVYIPNLNDPNLNKYFSSVQTLIEEISISVQWDQTDDQLQCVGQLQTNKLINGYFQLNFQVLYKPLGSTFLKIVSNTISQLQDSRQQVYLKQGKLEQQIKINFLECSVGEIEMYQDKSLICQQCPDGKYSLNVKDTSCQQCPDSAVKCIGSIIHLKNGYWRENQDTDDIVYCNYNPNSCQAESNQSKLNCIEGYIGPICKSCDTYGHIWENRYSQIFDNGICYQCSQQIYHIFFQNFAIFFFVSCYIFAILKKNISQLQAKLTGHFINKADILFLGSTLTSKDKPQIISKILTDHLQLLSLLNTFQISIPSVFRTSIGLSGNTLSVTSKSFDCIFSYFPNLQPLWFYQIIWSFTLPTTLFLTFILIGLLMKLFKNNNSAFKYLNTASIFMYFYFFPMVITLLIRSINCLKIGNEKYLDIDTNIDCYDSTYHKPYIFYFSIPLLIFWSLFIPLLLFLKIKNGKKRKWSIFVEIKYSFIFAGYKQGFFYWEFGKLIYKSLLILISIVFQQDLLLKLCLINITILLYYYLLLKFQPYTRTNFNGFQQKSVFLSALSLNVSSIQLNELNGVIALILILPNFLFILQLMLNIIQVNISSEKEETNKFQKCLLYFKQKFPERFENVQIIRKQRLQSIMKIKKVRNKIKKLVIYLKDNKLYQQETFQSVFNLEKTQKIPQNSPQTQVNKLESPNAAGIRLKKRKSEKMNVFNMKNNWNYYTRETKQNQLSSRLESSPDKFQLITQITKESSMDHDMILSANRSSEKCIFKTTSLQN